MGSHDEDHSTSVDYLASLSIGNICFPMALRAAIELNVFEIIAKAGPGAHLTSSQIASKLPTSNLGAATALDRILRMLSASSALSTVTVSRERAYGLTSQSSALVPDSDQFSIAPLLLMCSDKAVTASFLGLKHAVLEEGCVPFDKVHGVNFFEYVGRESRLNQFFNQAMAAASSIGFKEVLKIYQGFSEVEELLDVGGGTGTSLRSIVSKYPHIRGVNFDLSHVIAGAPTCPGVEHVAGDMFESIPSTQNVLLKWILHDWGDEHCIKLLKKCWSALPHNGKVIVVEFVLPQVLGNNPETLNALVSDLLMMNLNPGGKERTLIEYEELARIAGFSEMKSLSISHGLHVLEFIKN